MTNILLLSWKDVKNPLAGGAEVATFEIFRRLSKEYNITWFSSNYKNSLAKREKREGIEIVRGGCLKTVYLEAFKFYCKTKEEWDLVIDQINTVPFFTPLYVKQKILAYIHQLAWNVWDYELKVVSPTGKFFEWFYLSKIYKKVPFVTVSSSTKEDLKRFGIEKVFVVENGLNLEKYPLDRALDYKRENSVVYLGRITPMKRIEHVILSFALVKKKIKNVRLFIVGRAKNKKYLKKLKSLIRKLKLKDVYFLGYVSEEEKVKILSKAKVIVMTSVREGWGISILEGNACGCVAIGYNVPGLRDSIKNGVNGFLVKDGDVKGLAKRIVEVLENEDLFKEVSKKAINYAKNFSWDKSAKKFRKIIDTLLKT